MSAASPVAPSVAVVTGSSGPTGIGFAVARRLAAAGHAVVVAGTTDRALERADELRDEGFHAVAVVAAAT